MKFNERFLELFKKQFRIVDEKLSGVLDKCTAQGLRVDQYLLDKNISTEAMNAEIFAKLLHLRYVNIRKINVDPTVTAKVTAGFVEKNLVLPINRENGYVIVAVADPFNVNALNNLHLMISEKYELVVVSKKELLNVKNILESETYKKNIVKTVPTVPNIQTNVVESENLDVVNSPAVKLIESIFQEAILLNASDIHIEPYEDNFRVRYRLDGILKENMNVDIEMYSAISSRIKIISGLNIAEKRLPQDGRIKYFFQNKYYDFRISTLPTPFGEKIVIRILFSRETILDRAEIGFLKRYNAVIDAMLKRTYGIILLTGPTGSGKTTTLYSFIQEINSPEINIVTVEDPIEYTIKGINQVQVNTKGNLLFSTVLRSIFRQDPNVIMIGEIRDEETAEIAIRAAITGHLVLSTLHTNDAPGAVLRLIDMGVPAYLVSDALVGSISQRLIRKLCPECKKRHTTTPEEMGILNLAEKTTIYKARGCTYCQNTGYKGRTAVHEIFVVNQDIKRAILEKEGTETITDIARKNGMITLREACIEKILNGETTIEEMMLLE
jgi:type IV pilus assembly protein PilB